MAIDCLQLVFAFALVVGFSAGHRYTITVKTGTQSRPGIADGPGTDGDVTIKLFGLDYWSRQPTNTKAMKLSYLARNNFESGNSDKFQVDDSKYLIYLSKIEIRRTNSGLSPDWLLENVVVVVPNGWSYNFNGKFWLTIPDYDYTVPVNSAGGRYTIDVKTGKQGRPNNPDGPQTDATITVILYGVSKTTSQSTKTNPIQLLGGPSRNVLESGQTDTFHDLKDAVDVINLNKIEVMSDRSGSYPDWFLDKMVVTTLDGNSYHFHANAWVTEKNKPYSIPLTTNHQKYTIQVTTGSQSRHGIADGPGTDAEVTIKIFGRDRTNRNSIISTELLRLSYIGRNNFEPGSVNTFQGSSEADMIELTKIEIKRTNDGKLPDWLLQRVVITTQDGRTHQFNGDVWLTIPDYIYIFPVDSVAAKYKIVIKTGTQARAYNPDGPQTDATMIVILHGVPTTAGLPYKTNPIQLLGTPGRNLFESGQTDTFNVQDAINIININKIEIMSDGSGSYPDWLLNKVVVTGSNNQAYHFHPPNLWLTEKNKFYPVTVASNHGKYTILVTTGTQPRPGISDGPGTDSEVTLKLFGYRRTVRRQIGSLVSSEPMILSYIGRNNFEPGRTDTFEGANTHALDDITKIEIKRGNGGNLPDWLLERVVVITPTGRRYQFNGDFWLTIPEYYYTIPVNTAPTSYTIVVKTGTARRSGSLQDGPQTDSTITLILHGASKTKNPYTKTNAIRLVGEQSRNLFEYGQTDTFNDVKEAIDVIKLNRIEVKSDYSGPNPDWYLDKIIVTTSDSKIYHFHYNKWITAKDVYYPQNVAPSITYDIIVYTSSAPDASSSANMYTTMRGNGGTSDEIHLRSPSGQSTFKPSSSKVFQVEIPDDLKTLKSLALRQDGSGSSPNWKVDKVFVVVDLTTVYEFVFNQWLNPGQPVVQLLSDSFPATSIKLNSYAPCIHPLGSKVHPDPGTSLVLINNCGLLTTLFKFMKNKVILHLASGMCVQRDSSGNPKDIANGAKLILNPQCTPYFGTYTPHALQFKFTPAGSLREEQSKKCVYGNSGILNSQLTLRDRCDAVDNIIGFIDKSGKTILPDKKTTDVSPPSPPPAPPPPSKQPTSGPDSNPSKGGPGGNNSVTIDYPVPGIPNNCAAGCAASCQPSCSPSCCGGMPSFQPPQFPMAPTYPQPVSCPSYCTPAQCRSTCHIYCCTPKAVIDGKKKINPPKGHKWD